MQENIITKSQQEFQFKDIDSAINLLKNKIGAKNAKEELRRLAHHLRKYEYSGKYQNIFSGLLIHAELIKSITDLVNPETIEKDFAEHLSNDLIANIELHSDQHNHNEKKKIILKQLSKLNRDNPYTIIALQTSNQIFSLIIEKLSDHLSEGDKSRLAEMILRIFNLNTTSKVIFKKLNSNLRYLIGCPIKLHCINKKKSSNWLQRFLTPAKSSNLRIYNLLTGNVTVSYNHAFTIDTYLSDYISLNFAYSLAYIISKKNFLIDVENKKLLNINHLEQDTNQTCINNATNLIELTMGNLIENDKFVIGSLERKFMLNQKFKTNPNIIKQININELDLNGLTNLEASAYLRKIKVRKLQKLTPKIQNCKFDEYLAKNFEYFPQLVIDQTQLIRSKLFYHKAMSHIKEQNHSKAIFNLNNSIKLDSNFKDAYFHLALCYMQQDQYKPAIDSLTKSIEIDQNFREAYRQRGLCYGKIDKLDKSVIDFNIALLLNH
jgi:hypothetical protein